MPSIISAKTGTLFTVASSILVGGCGSDGFSFIPRNKLSEQKEGERVVVAIEPPDEKTGEVAIPLLAAAVPVLLDFGFKLVEKEIKREADRYTAEYTAMAVGDSFYEPCTGTPSESPQNPNVRLQAIIITREVMVKADPEPKAEDPQPAATQPENSDSAKKKNKDPKKSVTAMKLQLDVQRSRDGRYFRFVPSSVEVPYAKCKVRTSDNDIDLDVRVSLDMFWTDEKGAAKAESIDLPPIIVPGVPVGPKADWTDERSTAIAAHLGRVPSTWLPVIPRSTQANGGNTSYGTGTFAIRVKVKEYDNFGEKVKKVGEVVEKNHDDWVKDLAEAITGKSGS